MAFLSDTLDELGAKFGTLDNTAEKWTAQDNALTGFFEQIASELKIYFAPESTPIRVFNQAINRYQSLLTGLNGPSRGYLNLRFFIMLNGFMAACQESLEKAALNDTLDPAVLVEKSYYKPYFFDRVTLSTGEVRQMLAADLEQLSTASRDHKGVLLANRIRKGTVATLLETYCPAHPELYPLAAALEKIQVRNDPAVMDAVASAIKNLLAALD